MKKCVGCREELIEAFFPEGRNSCRQCILKAEFPGVKSQNNLELFEGACRGKKWLEEARAQTTCRRCGALGVSWYRGSDGMESPVVQGALLGAYAPRYLAEWIEKVIPYCDACAERAHLVLEGTPPPDASIDELQSRVRYWEARLGPAKRRGAVREVRRLQGLVDDAERRVRELVRAQQSELLADLQAKLAAEDLK